MEEEQRADEGGDLGVVEVGADQARGRGNRGVAGHAEAGGEGNGRDGVLRHREEIEQGPEGAEPVIKAQQPPFGQAGRQKAREQGAGDGRQAVDRKDPAGGLGRNPVGDELGKQVGFDDDHVKAAGREAADQQAEGAVSEGVPDRAEADRFFG